MRNSSTLAVGEKVYAIGAPEGLELTISGGLISGLRDFGEGEVIQTSAAISPGSSGGALFDVQGRLVGITTFYLKEGQSLNFALPAEWIASLLKRARAGAHAATNTPTEESDWLFRSLELEFESSWQGLLRLSQDWIAEEPRSDTGWHFLGKAYSGLGQYDRAVSAYQQALRLKPNVGAWTSLGEAYYSLGQYDKAASAEREAVRLQPSFRIWLDLGDAYHKLGQDDSAASAYERAETAPRALAERDAPVGATASVKASLAAAVAVLWTELGAAYDRVGRYDNAIRADLEAVRLNPGDADAWCDLGMAYIDLRQPGKALAAEEEAIRLKPDNEYAWVYLGFSYEGLEQGDKAVSAEQQAVRLKPNDAAAWFALGVAYRVDGKLSKVIKVYEKLKTLDPNMADEFFKEDVLP